MNSIFIHNPSSSSDKPKETSLFNNFVKNKAFHSFPSSYRPHNSMSVKNIELTFFP